MAPEKAPTVSNLDSSTTTSLPPVRISTEAVRIENAFLQASGAGTPEDVLRAARQIGAEVFESPTFRLTLRRFVEAAHSLKGARPGRMSKLLGYTKAARIAAELVGPVFLTPKGKRERIAHPDVQLASAKVDYYAALHESLVRADHAVPKAVEKASEIEEWLRRNSFSMNPPRGSTPDIPAGFTHEVWETHVRERWNSYCRPPQVDRLTALAVELAEHRNPDPEKQITLAERAQLWTARSWEGFEKDRPEVRRSGRRRDATGDDHVPKEFERLRKLLARH